MNIHNHMDTSCEPMDVDLSSNSANLTFKDHEEPNSEPVSTGSLLNNQIEPEVWNIKKYHIVRDKASVRHRSNSTLLIVGFLIILISFLVYCLLGIQCSNDLDLKGLKFKLSNRLYGQPEVIDNLIKSLEKNVKNRVIFIYGGTGVGKTFTISLALENFWNSSNVYHYTMPTFLDIFSTDTMLSLNICDSSIMVVDDLKHDDFEIKKQVADVIKKSENLNKNVTIILIYNCDMITGNFVKKCDDTFNLKLRQEYDEINAFKSYIEFKPLTHEILKMCIEDELHGKHVNNIQFNNILNNFNVTLDGCKGVHKKIKFLNLV